MICAMKTPLPRPPKHLRIYIKPHKFKNDIAINELYQIGKRFILKTFVNRDRFGKISPFCITHDGVLVVFDYNVNKDHYLGADEETKKFPKMLERAERLHWAKHLIMGRVNVDLFFHDGVEKRIYCAKDLNFVVVLRLRAEGIFELYTAYPITEKSTRHQMRRLFGLK